MKLLILLILFVTIYAIADKHRMRKREDRILMELAYAKTVAKLKHMEIELIKKGVAKL